MLQSASTFEPSSWNMKQLQQRSQRKHLDSVARMNTRMPPIRRCGAGLRVEDDFVGWQPAGAACSPARSCVVSKRRLGLPHGKRSGKADTPTSTPGHSFLEACIRQQLRQRSGLPSAAAHKDVLAVAAVHKHKLGPDRQGHICNPCLLGARSAAAVPTRVHLHAV